MKIWILNHYATNMYYEGGGRHQWFAKFLIRKGHDAKIFCANTIHNSDKQVNLEGKLYRELVGKNQVPYVFVKTTPYHGNGIPRIKNMCMFAYNVQKALVCCAQKESKPDIIFASSVHPLTLVAGLRMAKRFNVPCICEIRDLWPSTLVEYGKIRRNSFFAKCLYFGEKSIYKRADQLVFTMQGAKQYIIDKGWDNEIDLSKVNYINNGVDLDMFKQQRQSCIIDDTDLIDKSIHKVTYTGSIRIGNHVDFILELASHFYRKGNKKIKFLVFGDGEERERLMKRAEALGLDNIVFKGKVSKEYIPYILSKSDLNILDAIEPGLSRYGMSPNKLFEYMASGKPIISDMTPKYNIIREYGLGIAEKFTSREDYCNAIEQLMTLSSTEYEKMCRNAEEAARVFDFQKHTEDLIQVINKCKKERTV